MSEYTELRTKDDITPEIEKLVEEITETDLVGDYDRRGRLTGEMKERLWTELEKCKVNDKYIDLGTAYGTPAMKQIVKIARTYLVEG